MANATAMVRRGLSVRVFGECRGDGLQLLVGKLFVLASAAVMVRRCLSVRLWLTPECLRLNVFRVQNDCWVDASRGGENQKQFQALSKPCSLHTKYNSRIPNGDKARCKKGMRTLPHGPRPVLVGAHPAQHCSDFLASKYKVQFASM